MRAIHPNSRALSLLRAPILRSALALLSVLFLPYASLQAQAERSNSGLRTAPAIIAEQPDLLTAALEEELMLARIGKEIDNEGLAAALNALASIELPQRAATRARLAKTWGAAAALVRESEGNTPFLAELLKTASSLDPDDAGLAEAAAAEAMRLELIQARIVEAEVSDAKEQ